jgi:acyl-CoA oxidase
VRADAVGLVDGFDFPDFILKAPVGRYDGNIYEAYFSMVRDYGDFGGGQAASVAPYWDKLIAPILASVPSRSKL